MTTLVRSISSRPASTAHGELSRVFNSLFDSATPLAGPLAQPSRSFAPPIDIVEHDDEFVLSADLPGLSEADVRIEILDDVMTISGERRLEHEEVGKGYRRFERASGRFSRQLNLPKGVDSSAIRASFLNGVLDVHVPKPAQAKPQVVEISVATSVTD